MMKKKMVFILIPIVLIAAGLGIYFLMFAGGEEVVRDPNAPPEKLYYYVPGDYLVTNIMDSARLMKTTVVLALTEEGHDEYLTENQHIIRDTIIFLIRNKTEVQLRTPGVENQLRDEICEALKAKLDVEYLYTIYYNDFVLQ